MNAITTKAGPERAPLWLLKKEIYEKVLVLYRNFPFGKQAGKEGGPACCVMKKKCDLYINTSLIGRWIQ